jgi:hypothetical protein
MLRTICCLMFVYVAGAGPGVALAEVPILNPTQILREPFPDIIDFDVFDYGCSVAVDGNSAAAPDYEREAVLIYRRPSRNEPWVEAEQLPHQSITCSSVDLHEDTLIFEDAGLLRVYVYDGTRWNLQATLEADDGERFELLGFWGNGVFLDGNTVATNSPEAAYVFVRSNGTWTRQAKLTGMRALALHDNTLLIRQIVQFDPDNPDPSPRPVFVYERTAGTWTERQALLPSGNVPPESGGGFGAAAALHGDVAVIGAPGDAEYIVDLFDPAGAAYVFVRKGGQWTQQQKLTTPYDILTNTYYQFGNTVAIEPNRIVVGAPHPHSQGFLFPGRVFGFVRHGERWTEEFRWPPEDQGPTAYTGVSISLSNGVMAVASAGTPEFEYGAVSFFELNTHPVVAAVAVAVRPRQKRAVDVSATINDADTGGSNVRSAFYSVNGGKWRAMRAGDGVFDEPSEHVNAVVRNLRRGSNKICVIGVDGLRNMSRRECVRHVIRKP